MNTYKKTAIIVGILFFVCTVTSILGGSLSNPILDSADYLTMLAASWLCGWGFLAATLCLAVTLYSTFNVSFGLSTLNTILNAPIGLQEMVLAVWLIVKGFDPSASACKSVMKNNWMTAT